VFRSPEKRASEHIAIACRNSPLQNVASGQACSAVVRNDQKLILLGILPAEANRSVSLSFSVVGWSLADGDANAPESAACGRRHRIVGQSALKAIPPRG